MENLLQDIRFGLRMLLKSPGFTAVALLTLALGIGANTAIFSLVDAFLLRLLPVKNPQQLVLVQRRGPTGEHADDFPYPAFEQLRDRNHSFSGMFAYDGTRVSVTVDGKPEFISGDFVSGSYFDILGTEAIAGRTFTAEDDRPGQTPVAVISYAYWEGRFARKPSALGKTVYLAGIPFTVVGVTPAAFFGRNVAGRTADIILPMYMQPRLALRDHDTFEIMARLKPGISLEQARVDLNLIYRQTLTQAAGSGISSPVEQQIRTQKIELKPGLRGTSELSNELAGKLRILFTVVGIALLIASMNVANLLLARGAARHREIGMRLALGATHGRLIRQLLTESVLLAGLGGILGLLFAKWGVNALVAVLSYGDEPIRFGLAVDLRILSFTAVVCLGTGLLFGLLPAVTATRHDLNPVLKGSEGILESSGAHQKWGKSLVISQVALSLMLLIGAGLLLRTLQHLYRVDTGFERDKVVMAFVFPALNRYDHTKEMALYQKLLEEMNTLPGVRSATLSRLRLMSGRWFRNVRAPSAAAATNQTLRVYCNPVGPQFFQTMGIGLRLGREFSTSDTETAPRVAIISLSMAQRLFPSESPIGHRLAFADQANADVQVVGVVSNIKHVLQVEQPSDAVYIPYPQAPPDLLGQMNVVVRTSAEPSSVVPNIRERVLSIDRNLPLVAIETQETEIDEYLGGERSLATLLSFFGALALVLASIGLYGTMSYRVSRRTKELGIRMALGADAREMLVMVLRETLWLAGIGVAIGIPLSITAARLIASILFGVKTTDTVTMLAAVLLMGAVAVGAGYFPARRAAKVDPMVALRYE